MRLPGAPRWPLVVALLLGATQPMVHLWLQYCPPDGAVHSGLSVPDSALFLQSMAMFQSGYYSPYAVCNSPWRDSALAYYSVPHLWVYGVLGVVADFLYANHFLFLGLVNGISLAFYLIMSWRFLCAVAPGVAQPAFALFALSSGPAGLIWLTTGILGLHDSSQFEDWYFRFALYDLVEGPHFHPLLIAPRCYYTFPLGVFYGAMSAMPAAFLGKQRSLILWFPLVFLAAWIYARAGVFSIAIAMLMAGHSQGRDAVLRTLLQPNRLLVLAAYVVSVWLGVFASSLLMRLNPATVQNHLEITSMAMWISPALCSLGFLIPAILLSFNACWSSLPPLYRLVLGSAGGYLVAYFAIYLLRAAYYGTLLTGQDGAVAHAISDWALAGAPLGLLVAWLPRKPLTENRAPGWVLLWLVVFFAISVSGWGNGWFLRFGPQRLQVFLWLPACLLAAYGLSRLAPRWRRMAWVIFLTAGLSSMSVILAVFQAGAGRDNARGPFDLINVQWIQKSDAEAIALTQGKTVLSKPLLGDAAVRLAGARAPFAVGAFNLSDVPYTELHRTAEHFFSSSATDTERRTLVRNWCIDQVLVSDLRPIAPEAVAALQSANWLQLDYQSGGTFLFTVKNGANAP